MLNPTVHAHLTAAGFTHTHVPEEWQDVGGPERGPNVQGHHAFDMYERQWSPTCGQRVYTDGNTCHGERYDPQWEAEMARQWG